LYPRPTLFMGRGTGVFLELPYLLSIELCEVVQRIG
jgi:hypothetical protein